MGISDFLSSPGELYVNHIEQVLEQWNTLRPRVDVLCDRNLGIIGSDNDIQQMLICHDLGKLTQLWQKRIRDGKRRPPHAPVGAAYLFKTLDPSIREPIAFATLIHHTDSGIATDGLERPDVLMVQSGVIDFSGNIRWRENLQRELTAPYLPNNLNALRLSDITAMARNLRLWFRGTSMTEMHHRRLQAALFHHILRLCDVRAASKRNEFQDSSAFPFVKDILDGGMIC